MKNTVLNNVSKGMRALENLVSGSPTKTKKANWLLVGESWYNQRILDAIRLSGRQVQIFSIKEAWDNEYEIDPTTIILGPTGVVNKLSAKFKFKHWHDPKSLSCDQVYGNWGDVMYNSNYVLLPYGELLRRSEGIFESFKSARSQIFLRPNTPDRPFTGGLFSEKEVKVMEGFVDKGTLCLVSTPKLDTINYRFVIVGETAITGCIYYPHPRALYTSRMETFVNEVASRRYPGLPEIYIMDITTRINKFKVLGVNAINTVSWHQCNVAKIVEACSEKVEKV